jgi:hypothetical protein
MRKKGVTESNLPSALLALAEHEGQHISLETLRKFTDRFFKGSAQSRGGPVSLLTAFAEIDSQEFERLRRRRSRMPIDVQTAKMSIVFGHEETFIQAEPAVRQANQSMQVYHVGGIRVPEWWRPLVMERLNEKRPKITFQSFIWIDPDDVETQDRMRQSLEIYREGVVTPLILLEKPHLGIDILIVDAQHVFLGIYPHHGATERVCGIHIADGTIGYALSSWFTGWLTRPHVSMGWHDWKRLYVGDQHPGGIANSVTAPPSQATSGET